MIIPSFIFIRHGESCQNLLRSLKHFNKVVSYNREKLENTLKDPQLSDVGVTESKRIGIELRDWIEKNNLNVRFVCSSPMIRAIETAVYMTGEATDKNIPVFVMPYLREIDMHSKIITTKSTDSIYPLRTIEEQKEYLKKTGILDRVRFDYVDKKKSKRNQPGDIYSFIKYFIKKSIINFADNDVVIVVCHSGVMKKYFGSGFTNNNGFIIRCKHEILPLSKSHGEFNCNSTTRCNDFCGENVVYSQ